MEEIQMFWDRSQLIFPTALARELHHRLLVPRALATHPSFASIQKSPSTAAAATNPINCVEQAGSRSRQNIIILHLLATRGIGSTREPKSLLAVLSPRAMIIKNH